MQSLLENSHRDLKKQRKNEHTCIQILTTRRFLRCRKITMRIRQMIKPETGRINTLSFLEVKKEDFSYLSTGLSFRLVNFYLGGRKKIHGKDFKGCPTVYDAEG